jgi:hypothetical protein
MAIDPQRVHLRLGEKAGKLDMLTDDLLTATLLPCAMP